MPDFGNGLSMAVLLLAAYFNCRGVTSSMLIADLFLLYALNNFSAGPMTAPEFFWYPSANNAWSLRFQSGRGAGKVS